MFSKTPPKKPDSAKKTDSKELSNSEILNDLDQIDAETREITQFLNKYKQDLDKLTSEMAAKNNDTPGNSNRPKK